ncbi:MAG: hypothetical protein ABSB35_30285 [Bryobacteraceae bacterium]|jgi:hypothetical protein
MIWRALRLSYRWQCETERRGYDLAFYDDATHQPVAYAEIKRWWSDSEDSELPQIRRDLQDKLGLLTIPAIMLILTWNYEGESKANLERLAKELSVPRKELATQAFDSVLAGPGSPGMEPERRCKSGMDGGLTPPPWSAARRSI